MTATETLNFEEFRLRAALDFAQTMIVIDDEATQEESDISNPMPAAILSRPDRRTRAAAKTAETSAGREQSENQTRLNAKLLIERSMDLGLICSVLRPKNQEENLSGRVVKAAQTADIVCLDWEISNDSGDTAAAIIGNIIQKDAEQNGRLRLIAIYTGDQENDRIMEKIFDSIPEELREKHDFRQEPLKIESKNGVRIVCLFKKHGIELYEPKKGNQVGEDELPERLQREFAKLSEGLLSNVALATIASVRTSTHHVLSKFTGQMDGPFFHHRASIGSPDDAEEYAVDIVLSELKGVVDKHRVAVDYAGGEAIEKRIREMARASGGKTLKLHYKNGEESCTYDLRVDYCISMIRDGLKTVLKDGKLPNPPGEPKFRKNFSSLFSGSQETAHRLMHQFAVLTGVRAHPGSHLYELGQVLPQLGLGTIIRDKEETYLMCLQASCDSVRIPDKKSFLFVPLEVKDSEPEHVVPIRSGQNSSYIGLSTSNDSYCMARPIVFSASQDGTVRAESSNGPVFHFTDTENNPYLWIADLKRQRALRTVQRLGQNMGRVGFDEFEPYRPK